MERTPEQDAAIDDIRRRAVGGCSAEEFAALQCPVCGSGLKLDSHPCPGGCAFVFVTCIASSVHVGFSDRAEIAPVWWAAHRSGGWIIE